MLTESKSYIAVSADGRHFKARTGVFEKKIGDKITIDSKDFYVIMLHKSQEYAVVCMNLYGFEHNKNLAKNVLPVSITKNF